MPRKVRPLSRLRRWLGAGLVAATLPGTALAGCLDDAIIVFDGSRSMAQTGYGLGAPPRIDEARDAFSRALPAVPRDRPVGLLTYGAESCDSLRLDVAPRPGSAGAIIRAIDAMDPRGETPLAAAVTAAARALDHARRPATIVVVTDGLDTCGGAVCRVGRILGNQGAQTVIHTIYFRTPGDRVAQTEQMWRSPPGCLAFYTGGEHIPVRDTDELTRALSQTLGCPLFGGALIPHAAG